MARPRKDSARPGARQRITEAYWALAAERAFPDIAVDQILKRAGCNRTTFYYHFENLAAVRAEAEKQRLTSDKFLSIARLVISRDVNSSAVRAFYDENLDLIRYLARQLARQLAGSPQGEASDRFRAAVRAMWIEQGFLRGDGGDSDLLLAAHIFLINGLLGSIASLADLREDEFFVRLDSFSQLYSTTVMSVLADVLPASALEALE
ncbi:TetR/AcrR family transcriptional regulator [Rothia nasisuis]|uniref:TetR/AcrR family transcriptional regulator n=1 Tax=Rothia nasisuis TaxID=2109647 RepID=UPI001F24B523|nr:TetR/AcrR family transcriptional regulator [Rothia nasisuis]